MSFTDVCATLLIPSSIIIHLLTAPYTKVEESFNIQACHDIINYGLPFSKSEAQLRQQYDHLTFPGAVPRTFVGSLALAALSWPFLSIASASQYTLQRQILVRAILGLWNALCLIYLRHGVAKTFGKTAANWFAVLQASQFHIMYYSSRTLPNFFAFGITSLAACYLFPDSGLVASEYRNKRIGRGLFLLTLTGIIFRSELAILLLCHTGYIFLNPRLRPPLMALVKPIAFAAVIGLGLTVAVDTLLWQSATPMWPELSSFVYNVVNSKSQEWGVAPWHFYWTSSLPRLLFNPFTLLCIPFTLLLPAYRGQALDILTPNLLYVAIYSFQPHKEWRFIVYVIPPFLAVASAGAGWIWLRREKTTIYRVLSLALLASTLAAYIASFGMLGISRLNYPGAEALNRFHKLVPLSKGSIADPIRVHMDTLACMTGVTRFLQERDGHGRFIYDKTEDPELLLDPGFWSTVDYAIAEKPERLIGLWEEVDAMYAFDGVRVLRPGEEQDDRSTCPGLHKESTLRWLECCLEEVVAWARPRLTRGWWVVVRKSPRLKLMRRAGREAQV